jgi:hypothetical protein
MMLNYENTVDDAVEAFYFRTYGTPETKKVFRILRWIILPSIFVTLLSIIVVLQQVASFTPFPFFILPPFIILMLSFMSRSKSAIRAQIQSQLKHGGKNSVHQLDIGRRTVAIRPDGIFVNTDNLGDTRIPWAAIDGVFTEKEHHFVRWTGGQILTIPRRIFTDTAQEAAFLAEIQIRRREVAIPVALAPVVYGGASSWSAQNSPVIINPVTNFVSGNPTNDAVNVPETPSPSVPPVSGAPWWSGQTSETIGEAEKTVLKQGRQ